MDDNRLKFLIETYKDCRGEIEKRISQRDTFSMQFIIATGTIISVGMLNFTQSPYLYFLLPFITLFYAIQIIYSYAIHDRLHYFIVTNLEPEIARILGYSNVQKNRLLWESYCEVESIRNRIKSPGIRKGFFIKVSYVSPFVADILFLLVGMYKNLYPELYIYFIVIGVYTVAVIIIMFLSLRQSSKKLNKKGLEKLACCDYINLQNVNTALPKKAIFIDRDGTIYVDKKQTHRIEDLHYFNDTFSTLKKLQDLGFIIVVCTNQDGLRQKVYTQEEFHKFNCEIIKNFKDNGIDIAAVYYSPFEAKDNHFSFKPNPGMLVRAQYELKINLLGSYMIGDQITDVIAAERVGVKGIMVTTGLYPNNNYKTADYLQLNPTTVGSLTDAYEYIVNDISKK